VVAIDLSPTLVDLARERLPRDPGRRAGRLPQRRHARPGARRFDHVVAMDSLIHYDAADACARCRGWPTAPRLDGVHLRAAHADAAGAMHTVGRAVPARRPRAGDRAGGRARRCAGAGARRRAAAWHAGRTQRVASGFYTSQALELLRSMTNAKATSSRHGCAPLAAPGAALPALRRRRHEELPLARLLRLSLFQVTVGMAAALMVGTLNRVMIVELGVAAWLVALMVALPLVFAPFRA
jgi:hypothetical protein